MKKLLLIAAASATILSSTLSFADCAMDTNQAQNENKWYLKANAGATIFDKAKDKGTGIKMKSNTSFIGEIGVGYYIMENVRTDLTLAMVSNAELKKTVTQTADVSSTISVKHKPTITSLLINGYVDFVDVGMFKVFGGAGIGASLVKEKITGKNVSSYTYNYPPVSTKNKTNFAYQVSLGTSAEVAEGVKAELVYSWRDYGKIKTKTVDEVKEGGTRYKGHNVMAGIRFDI